MSETRCKHGRGSAEALACLKCEREDAADKATKQIVTWLQAGARGSSAHTDRSCARFIAEAIARGEHLKPPPPAICDACGRDPALENHASDCRITRP